MTFFDSQPRQTPNLVSFWKHHPIADQKAQTLAESTLAFQQKFNCDFIKITPAGSWQAVCHGVTDKWDGDFLGRRIITNTIIAKPEDWLLLPDFPQTLPTLLQEIVGACRLVHQESRDSKPILSTVFCPISQAIQIAGLSVFLEHIEKYPDKLLAGLERITQNTLFAINELIKSGTKGIYFVTQHMRYGALTPDVYKTFGEAFDERCLVVCKDLTYNIFHIHGAEIYLSLGNIPSNCFIHYESIPENKLSTSSFEKYTSKLIAGIPATDMAGCQSDEEIQQLIADKSYGKITTCGCVLPLDFPDESIKQWMQVSKNMFQSCS
jgi:uroporphyrinogen decarboxylase